MCHHENVHLTESSTSKVFQSRRLATIKDFVAELGDRARYDVMCQSQLTVACNGGSWRPVISQIW